jgi:hypothetical protein
MLKSSECETKLIFMYQLTKYHIFNIFETLPLHVPKCQNSSTLTGHLKGGSNWYIWLNSNYKAQFMDKENILAGFKFLNIWKPNHQGSVMTSSCKWRRKKHQQNNQHLKMNNKSKVNMILSNYTMLTK